MRKIKLGNTQLEVPVVAVGCMRIRSLEKPELERYVQTALELGANFFDHADIYGSGECEELFAEAIRMNDDVREKVILQSKCGIRKDMGTFDFSREHILTSVDNSLRRLKTDYLDVLLLHRPDALVEPEEVAETFNLLESTGKVRHFGVSNMNAMQIALLQKHLKQPVVANQLKLSVTHAGMITNGINVNMTNDASINRDGSVLDYCRLHDITIQPYSPFQHGTVKGTYLGNPDYPEVNKAIDELAAKYGVSNTTIVFAWILRHPAHMQPIAGTTNVERLTDCCKGSEIELTREEWYSVYRAAGNRLP